MARAATTADVFNAIAEPWRRAIIELLAARGAQSVSALVAALGLSQTAVSKHLSVLRQVGVVSAAKAGRQRMYRLDAEELKPVHDWAQSFERFWGHQLAGMKERAERAAAERSADEHRGDMNKES